MHYIFTNATNSSDQYPYKYLMFGLPLFIYLPWSLQRPYTKKKRHLQTNCKVKKIFLWTMASSSLPQPPLPSTTLTSQQSSPPPSQLPIRKMPGSYGLPLVGPLTDRLDYFWFQGPEKFFKSRSEKYKSTVFRTNIPPAFPFLGNVNPNIVAVLDVKSFSYLFDMDLVDKRDVLIGDFRPSLDFYGGTRVGVYLDTTEPKHAKVCTFLQVISSN